MDQIHSRAGQYGRSYDWLTQLTNLLFLSLSVYGMYRVSTERLAPRFYGCALGIGIVGFGSFLFHMTLKFEAQLLDELPMIWASSFMAWSMLDQTLFFGRPVNRYILPIFIFAIVTWITVAYVANGDPVFHQVAYASIMVVSILHAIYIMVHPRSPLNVSDSARRRRSEARFLEQAGTVLFLIGFGIWNVDNIFCGYLRAAREAIGYPFALLLEGHGWWHIFTGCGAYMLLLSCEIIAMTYMEHPDNFVVRYDWIPYVQRIRPYDPARTLLGEFQAQNTKKGQ